MFELATKNVFVTPAQAGAQAISCAQRYLVWATACAGVASVKIQLLQSIGHDSLLCS
jgi:hypothetical protein